MHTRAAWHTRRCPRRHDRGSSAAQRPDLVAELLASCRPLRFLPSLRLDDMRRRARHEPRVGESLRETGKLFLELIELGAQARALPLDVDDLRERDDDLA